MNSRDEIKRECLGRTKGSDGTNTESYSTNKRYTNKRTINEEGDLTRGTTVTLHKSLVPGHTPGD